ncbi:unnamed protein product [Paramecium pentaurelia]|uniref:Ethanolamine kinase n=1 Tax=Paramecium pentaurelia TaxID=43138 RepID=A0A8S1U1Y2_9CILI|nr:unnamed protein product [Paramecium pentaurelia]
MNNIDQFFISHIQKFVPSWSHLQSDDLRITKTIGITNKTYIIEADATPSKIIFRHFGEVGVGLFLNREQELHIARQVAKCKMGPHFYGHTQHVRLEEYIENEVMSQESMKDPETYTLVAQTLCKFHQIDISGQMNDRTPLFEKHLQENSDFLQQVREKVCSNLFSEDERSILSNMAHWFSEEEVKFLQSVLPKDDIVFSHNDLLANNILLIPPNFDKVVFIDFEYSSYNFRGFDIANYFNESQFSYLNPNPPYFYIEEGMIDEDILKDFVKVYIEKSGLDLDYQNLLHQVYIGQLFSHFFWAAWGIIMAKSNDIVFDYLAFVEVRYHKYYQLKKHLFGKK